LNIRIGSSKINGKGVEMDWEEAKKNRHEFPVFDKAYKYIEQYY